MPAPKGWREVPDRYRIVDEFPYLDREDEYDGLTLDEAAVRFEDLCPYPADEVHANVAEGVLPIEWVDDEVGRRVTLSLTIERDVPEAGDMEQTDGLGA